MDEKGLVNRWGWNDAQFDMILERYNSRVDDRLTLTRARSAALLNSIDLREDFTREVFTDRRDRGGLDFKEFQPRGFAQILEIESVEPFNFRQLARVFHPFDYIKWSASRSSYHLTSSVILHRELY